MLTKTMLTKATSSTANKTVDVYIGNRLRMLRASRNLSQERVGELLGITFQQVQKYEKGANRIGGSRLHQLSQALNVEPGYFFPPTTPSADAEREALSEIMTLLGTKDGLRLAHAFNKISKPNLRLTLCDLAEEMAKK